MCVLYLVARPTLHHACGPRAIHRQPENPVAGRCGAQATIFTRGGVMRFKPTQKPTCFFVFVVGNVLCILLFVRRVYDSCQGASTVVSVDPPRMKLVRQAECTREILC